VKEKCAMDLTGKAALVTGGSGDLGGAIARALATAGVDVAVTYTSRPDEAKATATAVRAAGRRSLIVPLDQRDRTAIDAAVETVAREFGRVDILVNRSKAVLGRTASTQDIAEQVVTFCRADSVTGQVLVVDGGMPAGMH
jgi:NAD(P)-dependent dehydrogenase (short-subunit alcohol dehydrogenase family)